MKKLFSLFFLSLLVFAIDAQTTYTVGHSGFTFTPDLINCRVGDIVHFNLTSEHPVLQVSQSTWNTNGNAALSGGFFFPTGQGDYTATAIGTLYYVCIPHVGPYSMKGSIIIAGSTPVEDIKTNVGFRFYPNPAYDYIIFHNTENLSATGITIMDVTGRSVLQIEKSLLSDEIIRLDISSLKKGVYFVSLRTENTRISQKFMKL